MTGRSVPGKEGAGVALPEGTGENVASFPFSVMTAAGGIKL